MEHRPLMQEEPPDAVWRDGGPPPPQFCQDKEKDRPLWRLPKSLIRGSGTQTPQPDALIIASNKYFRGCVTLFSVQNICGLKPAFILVYDCWWSLSANCSLTKCHFMQTIFSFTQMESLEQSLKVTFHFRWSFLGMLPNAERSCATQKVCFCFLSRQTVIPITSRSEPFPN